MVQIDGISLLILVGLPYTAVGLAIAGFIHRYRHHNYSVVNPSSQFMEDRKHFWSLVPFHFGLLTVLFIHAVALLFPNLVLAWNASTIRLYLLEVFAVSCGVLSLVGLVQGLVRRVGSHRFRRLTQTGDWLLLALILIQVSTGILTALFNRWGTSWMAAAAAPYFRSLLFLNPDIGFLISAPLLTKIHLVNAFLLIAYLPYSKLIHSVLVPLFYFWRAPIVYRWKRRREY